MEETNDKIGFIFDLDGTLINSTEVGDKVGAEIYAKFNIEMTDELKEKIDEFTEKMMQEKNRKSLVTKIIWELFKILGLNFFQRVKALLLANKIFKEEINKVKMFEGVEALFNFLDENKYPYSILTTSSSKEVDDRLINFPKFYEKLKGKIISRSDVQNLKPHPEGGIKAAAIMKVPTHKCVMVGDMTIDIQLGKNINALTIAVLTGVHTKEKFREVNPDYMLNSISEISNIFKELKERFKH